MRLKREFMFHPCFAEKANRYARIHLPVAPACNIQCRYCLRKFCCANECRPGVTARVMSPEEGLAWYASQKQNIPEITVAGIAGPGDALANWNAVKETLQLVRQADADVFFCLSTNGLLLPEYAQEVAETGVKFLTVTVNCVSPGIGARLYSYVYYQEKMYRGKEAASLLFRQQVQGIKLAKKLGMYVKINCVAIDGVNEKEIEKVAQLAGNMGCDVMNIIPLLPVPGSELENARPLPCDKIEALRKAGGKMIRQMKHCNRCRADAVGTLK